MLRIADLCSGTGAATAPFFERGHDVDRFELPRDICLEAFTPGQYDFVWASPPCTEYSRLSMPWHPIEAVDVGLWCECLRLIGETEPRYWVLENARGAQYIWGKTRHCGSFYMWGVMPAWPQGDYRKDYAHVRNPKERARIPRGLAVQVADIVERAFGYKP